MKGSSPNAAVSTIGCPKAPLSSPPRRKTKDFYSGIIRESLELERKYSHANGWWLCGRAQGSEAVEWERVGSFALRGGWESSRVAGRINSTAITAKDRLCSYLCRLYTMAVQLSHFYWIAVQPFISASAVRWILVRIRGVDNVLYANGGWL